MKKYTASMCEAHFNAECITYMGSRVFESHVFKASRFSMIIFQGRAVFLQLCPCESGQQQ